MKNLIILLLIVIASGLLPEHCVAKGRTDSLADRADAVVVGEIQSAQQMGSSVSLALLVVRSLKGSLTAGSIVTVPTHLVGQVQAKGNLAGQYGIWFLRQTGGQWTFIPKDGFSGSGWATTYLPLPKTGLPANVHTSSVPATVGDMIAVEITAALLSDPTHAHLSGPDSMYWGLREVEISPVVHELYELLHSNANLELRFIGLAGLLGGSGGTTALKEIADNMDLIPKLRSDVATTICGVRNIDPAAVQSLGKIATSPNQTLQRCAAVALKAIHTRDTLPLLAQLLDSTDRETRMWAVAGFSSFVMNRPVEVSTNIPGALLAPRGPTPYRTADTDKHAPGARSPASTDDTADVQFWKSWWASMRAKLMP